MCDLLRSRIHRGAELDRRRAVAGVQTSGVASSGRVFPALTVRALGCGVTETRIAGWEGEGYVLSIPGLSMEGGVALARHLTAGRQWRDVTADEVFPGEVVLQDPEPEVGETFLRVRPCRAGGAEIERTSGSS